MKNLKSFSILAVLLMLWPSYQGESTIVPLKPSMEEKINKLLEEIDKDILILKQQQEQL